MRQQFGQPHRIVDVGLAARYPQHVPALVAVERLRPANFSKSKITERK
jgi:hypothetical protein